MTRKQLPVGEFTSAYRWKKRDPAWIPEISDNLIARYQKLKSGLNVERRAQNDGQQNKPDSSEKDLNECQLQIRNTAVEKIRLLYAFLSEQLSAASQNMAQAQDDQQFENKLSEARIDLNKRLAADPRLKSSSEALEEAEKALRYFVAKNDIRRPPSYKESTLLFWSVLFGFLVVESFVNAFVFQDISSRGFVGGMLIACLISLANILLGLLGGAVGWRLLGHRFVPQKAFGLVVTIATIIGAVLWNLVVAHYRQIAEKSKFNADNSADTLAPLSSQAVPNGGETVPVATNPFADAWSHMQTDGWFALDTLESWFLLGFGLIIFLLAAREAWDDLADRYWDYRKYDLKRKKADEAFEELCAEAVDDAEIALDSHIEAAKKSHASLVLSRSKSEAIADLAEQRLVEVRDSEAVWINEANNLLQFYREQNERVRDPSLGKPLYWNVFPPPEEYRLQLAQSWDGGVNALELAESQIDDIRRRRSSLNEIVDSSSKQLKKFESDVLILKASVPELARELRDTVKNEAARSLNARLNQSGS